MAFYLKIVSVTFFKVRTILCFDHFYFLIEFIFIKRECAFNELNAHIKIQ